MTPSSTNISRLTGVRSMWKTQTTTPNLSSSVCGSNPYPPLPSWPYLANSKPIQRSRSSAAKTVDLDQVSARFLEPVRSRRRSISIPRSETASYRTPTSEEIYLVNFEYEKEYYDRLVKDGGRPILPNRAAPGSFETPRGAPRNSALCQPSNPTWGVFDMQSNDWDNFCFFQGRKPGLIGKTTWRDILRGYRRDWHGTR